MFFNQNISRLAQEDLACIMGVRQVLGARTYLGLPLMIGRSKRLLLLSLKGLNLENNKFLEG